MKKLFIVLVVILTLLACNLADKRISELRTLTERVEKRGERFTDKEWQKAYLEYANLEADFDDLRLTDEQADVVYALKQRFRKACVHSTREATTNVVEEVITYIEDETIDICNDVSNAIKDKISVDSIE